MSERSKDDIIIGLAQALYDQMQWAYVDNEPHEKPKGPPYKVPFSIQSDLAKLTQVADKGEAYRTIKQAIATAAGLKPEDF